jgi:hypothetical protein
LLLIMMRVVGQVHTHPTLCEVLDEAFKGAVGRAAHVSKPSPPSPRDTIVPG